MNLLHVKNDSSRAIGSFISIDKAGLISFSKEATKNLKLGKDTKVMFLQDADKPKDWYLSISNDADVKLRMYKDDRCGFSSSSIAKKIKSSLDYYSEKALKIPLGLPFESDGKTLIALVTAKLG